MSGPEAGTRSRPARGAELELEVTALAHGGSGVARHEGYVVFVRDAIPGDRVLATVTKAKRAYAEAHTTQILSPSPDRVPPRAQHPGAPWQVLPYERQLEVKREQIDEALRRIGRLDGFQHEPIVPAIEQWRYRNKLEYSFGTDVAGRLLCGFHAPGSWHEIVEFTDCLLASERANELRERIVVWCRREGLTAYDRRTGEGLLRNLVVREGRRSGQLQARLVTAPRTLPEERLAALAGENESIFWTRTDSLGETTQGGETKLLAGHERLEEEIGPLRLRISPQAFLQTNTEMAETLYALALEYAQPSGFERVYDLYCGIGTIALQIAPRVAEVWGLELVEEAIADAIRIARENQIDNARFYAGDVRLALRELVAEAGRPNLLIVDPPRSGLSQKVVRRIIEASPQRIVYVSCNPTTLAPNAAQLVEGGYVFRRVRGVDMFPQTPHIECVAEFVRAA